jgi:hypothetical protein
MKTMLSAVLVAIGLTLGTSAFAETAPPARQDGVALGLRAGVERKEERQDFAKARQEQERAEARFADAKRREAAAVRDLAQARRAAQHGNAERAAREQQMARQQMEQARKDIEAARRDMRRAQELRAQGRQDARPGWRPNQR